MADAVAHGVTKTTPNATHRRGPQRYAGLEPNWAEWAVAPFAAALVPTLRLMTSREPTDCGLY